MSAGDGLATPRLVLRPWRDDDLAPLAALNADPLVMAHLPARLDRRASDAVVARFRAHAAEHGFAPLALEVRGGPPFVGYVGLLRPRFAAPFTPCVEIGWRLARAHWGHGYATEAARAVLADAFARLGLGEVVAFTTPDNVRSRAVMERLAMTHAAADDFDHPSLPDGHPLRRHVLYRARPGPATPSVAPIAG